MTKTAPIVLFVYNRLEHTKKTIESLKNNELASQSDLIIFSDGPKNQSSKKSVNDVRKYIKKISGFKTVSIIEKKDNKGLANSIISGVTQIVNKYGRIIVLEDDMISSKYFLDYMNDSLDMYENEEEVISIHGYSYPVKGKLPKTFFIKGTDCWGWATWKRGWDIFETDGKRLYDEIIKRKLKREFDFNDSYPYTEMLNEQAKGKNNSWAVRWYASAFLKNKLTLHPGVSMIRNIGLDSSGTHCSQNNLYDVKLTERAINIVKIPNKHSLDAHKKIGDFLKKTRSNTIIKRVKRKVKKIIKTALPDKCINLFRKRSKYGWFGDYKSWKEAKKYCTSYNSKIILEKVRNSLLKVKNGEAVYERDSVLFDRIQYSWPLLSTLMWVAAQNYGKLNVLDFGGSLGTTYFQNKKFLDTLKEVKWNIVEQKEFVDEGKHNFEDKKLKFYSDLKSCFKKNKINLIILSSILQYLEDPYKTLEDILKYNPKYIIIDNMPFSYLNRDVITVQNVPPGVYNASYPCRLLSYDKMIKYMSNNYIVIEEFDSELSINIGKRKIQYKGIILKIKKGAN